jgi:hypothetical protein
MSDKVSKLSEYAYASEQEQEAMRVLTFLRNMMGTYEFERNLTVKFIEGYLIAMKKIINQAEL